MGRTKTAPSAREPRRRKPAPTMEAREDQLIALAYDLVEQRMLRGTATSQETVHFLRLGSTKERIEKEIMQRQKELLEAKTEAIQSAKRVEELYNNALNAMKKYRYTGDDNE